MSIPKIILMKNLILEVMTKQSLLSIVDSKSHIHRGVNTPVNLLWVREISKSYPGLQVEPAQSGGHLQCFSFLIYQSTSAVPKNLWVVC